METPPLPQLTILVVDDEPDFAKALAALLSRDGHTVETAENGRVALVQVHERRYDLILCDLRLPELDGPDLYQQLKTEAPDMYHRVIFLTGDTLNPISLEFLEKQHLLWLPKPCSAAQVRDVMQQALRHADSRLVPRTDRLLAKVGKCTIQPEMPAARDTSVIVGMVNLLMKHGKCAEK